MDKAHPPQGDRSVPDSSVRNARDRPSDGGAGDPLPEHLSHLAGRPIAYTGDRFDIRSVDLPGRDGQTHQRDVVVHRGAVVILPMLGPDHAVLIRNHRPAINRELWELPAGTLEPDEPPASAAARELVEETGYRACSLWPFGSMYSAPGFCTELLHVFIATGLRHVGQSLDATESITVEVIPWVRTMQMMREGAIVDAKTIAVLASYDVRMR